MEEAYTQLYELKDSSDIQAIKLSLDRIKRINTANPSHEYKIDTILKSIFRNNFTAELFDRIEDLFSMIKDPRMFLDELDTFTQAKHLVVPTLMFIFDLKKQFDMEYDEFYTKLCLTVQKENCISEGYLLFLLKALKSNSIDEDLIEPIIFRLSEVSVEIPSKCCAKVIYTIIVILRMHPGLFRITPKLGQIYMLLNSFEYIARIARRIFIESENPHLRPSMVFLENFVFPTGEDE